MYRILHAIQFLSIAAPISPSHVHLFVYVRLQLRCLQCNATCINDIMDFVDHILLSQRIQAAWALFIKNGFSVTLEFNEPISGRNMVEIEGALSL